MRHLQYHVAAAPALFLANGAAGLLIFFLKAVENLEPDFMKVTAKIVVLFPLFIFLRGTFFKSKPRVWTTLDQTPGKMSASTLFKNL